MKYTKEEQLICFLLRSAVGNVCQYSYPVTREEWATVVDLGLKNGIAALLLEGYSKMKWNEANSLPSDIRIKLLALVAYLEHDYVKHERVIVKLAFFYESHGIKMMLLKGFDLAAMRLPLARRTCGVLIFISLHASQYFVSIRNDTRHIVDKYCFKENMAMK